MTGEIAEKLFFTVLEASLPHRTWGVQPDAAAVRAAHNLAWDGIDGGEGSWINLLLAERSLPGKLRLLRDRCDHPDLGSQAVAQVLAAEPTERAAAFAFALYPAAVEGRLPIGAEGVNDLGKVAGPILAVDGEITWQERRNLQDTVHPEHDRFARVLGGLVPGSPRRERARQFFDWCLVHGASPADPAALEAEIDACVRLIETGGAA